MRVTKKNRRKVQSDLQNLSTIINLSNLDPTCKELQEMVNEVMSYGDSFKSVFYAKL